MREKATGEFTPAGRVREEEVVKTRGTTIEAHETMTTGTVGDLETGTLRTLGSVDQMTDPLEGMILTE